MDIHKVIGKILLKPKKGFVLRKHHFTRPYNPLHLQLDTKDNPLLEMSHLALMKAIEIYMSSVTKKAKNTDKYVI